MQYPTNCPRPCWYAYMQWYGGSYKLRLPTDFLQFVQWIKDRAAERAVIGWGYSRGAAWLIELTRNHGGLLDAAVMFAGYPWTNDKHDQHASAQELIAIRNCAICLVNFAADLECGPLKFPHWHADLNCHMVKQHKAMEERKPYDSPLCNINLQGHHQTPYPMWLDWQMPARLQDWFDSMWKCVVERRQAYRGVHVR